MDEATTDIDLILKTGNYLLSGVLTGFKAGRSGSSKPLKFDGIQDTFKNKYTGVERSMLQNFISECFHTAGILNYRMQEKLKELAENIMKGRTGEQVSRGEEKVDPKKLFVERAKGLLEMYQYTGKIPPEGHLKTNFRTATTSAYHGSLWKKIETAGIYKALQYKTRKDKRVRPEHKTLDDKIFYIDDPIWKIIYPPNSWNCRCYTKPLTLEDIVGKNVENPVRATEEEKTIVSESGISKEFARNPGMTDSIYNKWMDSELEEINFLSWFKKVFDYDRSVTKLLTKENLESILEENASPYRSIEPTKENWDKEFPGNECPTVLNDIKAYFKNDLKIEGHEGRFTAFEKLIELGKKDGRHKHIGLIKPTLQDALIVLKNSRGAIVFAKSFKKDNGRIDFTTITFDKGDLLEVVSEHRRNIEYILREFKGSEVLHLLAVASKRSDKFSRNASHPVSAFAEPRTKLTKPPKKYNEVWAERKFSKEQSYYSIIRFITYTPEGIEILKIDRDKSSKQSLDYPELSDARKGMLIYQTLV